MADVDVVIGNYQGADLLAECVASLRSQSSTPRAIIMADAASRDASVDVARALDVHVIDASNRGLGALYNLGAAAGTSQYILFCNNDVAFDTRCVELLAAELDLSPDRFAADPTQVDWDESTVIHARTTITRGRLVHEFLPGLHLDDAVPASVVVPTVSAHGAAMLVRRSMFDELDGFDETFFLEWEDLDLCWRAWLRGWSSVYVPDARVRHRVGAVTTTAVQPRRSASSHHNLTRFALKCLPARVAATVVLGELLRLPRHPRAIGTGLAKLLPEAPEIARLRTRLGPKDSTFARIVGGSDSPRLT